MKNMNEKQTRGTLNDADWFSCRTACSPKNSLIWVIELANDRIFELWEKLYKHRENAGEVLHSK